jgi:hypothetical protein
VDFFRGFALTSNTVKSYRSQYTAFVSICDTYGVDSSRPLDELDLCLVMSVYADSHKITTVPLFISALAHYTRLVFNADLPPNAYIKKHAAVSTTSTATPTSAHTRQR